MGLVPLASPIDVNTLQGDHFGVLNPVMIDISYFVYIVWLLIPLPFHLQYKLGRLVMNLNLKELL